MRTVYKREMGAYFRSPVAYTIIAVFMLMVGLFFWVRNLLYASTDFSGALSMTSTYLTFMMPILTMKLLADERRSGAEVLLRTSPVPMWKIVVGKYFAALTLYAIMVALTAIYPIIMTFLSENGVPVGKTFGGYVGFFLLGATYLAISLFASSFTESQVVAAVSGIVALLVLYYLQSIGATIGGTFGSILQWLSPLKRYSDFSLGGFNIASLVFYITFSGMMVFMSVLNVERRRWQ